MEVHHGSFGLPVLPAVEFDGFHVLDRKSGREVGVAEGPVGHEDTFAVGHACVDVAPGPFVCQQQVTKISRRADFPGLFRRQLSPGDQGGSADQCDDEEVVHGFADWSLNNERRVSGISNQKP